MTLKVPRCEFVHGLKCEDVSRRITSLEQERDSAREQLRNALDDTRWLNEQNARLRELAAEMYRLMDESCAVQHPFAPEPIRYDTLLYVHEKLRKLGVTCK